MLGLLLVGPRWGCYSQVKSESRHHSCQASVYSSVLSCCNKELEWRTLKPSACHSSWTDTALRSRMDRVIPLRQISVTALFYLDNNRKIHSQGVRACRPKDARRRVPQRVGERERARESSRPLAILFMFFLPLGLPYVNWVSQECCLFYLRSSLWSSDIPLFYFCGLFSSLSFSHRHSGLHFLILTT